MVPMVENKQTGDPPQNKGKIGIKKLSEARGKSYLEQERKVTGVFHRRVSHQSIEFCTNLLHLRHKKASQKLTWILLKNKTEQNKQQQKKPQRINLETKKAKHQFCLYSNLFARKLLSSSVVCSVWVNTGTSVVNQSKILTENNFYKYILEIRSAVFCRVLLFALCKCSDEPWLLYFFIHTNICKTFEIWSNCLFAKKFIRGKSVFVILPSLSIWAILHSKTVKYPVKEWIQYPCDFDDKLSMINND